MPAAARISALVLVTAVCVGLAACRTESHAGPRKRGPAPVWTLKNLQGNPVSSTEFRGKIVLLNFWADWCAPCRAEIPGFVALQEKFRDRGLAVVGISVGGSTPTALARITRELHVNYPVLVADEKVQAAFGGARPIPQTFVIDREGRIISRHTGFTPGERLEAEVVPLLER